MLFIGRCVECGEISEVVRRATYDGPDFCESCRSADSFVSVDFDEESQSYYDQDGNFYSEDGNFLYNENKLDEVN
jgi:hypothetical protein